MYVYARVLDIKIHFWTWRRIGRTKRKRRRGEARRGEIAGVTRTLAMVAGWILARRAARTFSSCRYRGASRRFSRPPLHRFSPWVQRQPAAGPLKSSATFHAIPTTHPIKLRLTSPRLAKPSLAPRALSPIHPSPLPFPTYPIFRWRLSLRYRFFNSKYISPCLLLLRVPPNRGHDFRFYLFNFLSYSQGLWFPSQFFIYIYIRLTLFRKIYQKRIEHIWILDIRRVDRWTWYKIYLYSPDFTLSLELIGCESFWLISFPLWILFFDRRRSKKLQNHSFFVQYFSRSKLRNLLETSHFSKRLASLIFPNLIFRKPNRPSHLDCLS